MNAQKLFALMKERGVKVRIASASQMIFTGDFYYVKYFEDYLSSHKELREEILREISSEQTDIQTESKELSAMNLSEFQRESELYGASVRINMGGKLNIYGGNEKIRHRLSMIIESNAKLKSELYEQIISEIPQTVYGIMKAYSEAMPEAYIVYRECKKDEVITCSSFGCHEALHPALNGYYGRNCGYELLNIMSLFKADVYLPSISDEELLNILDELTEHKKLYHETLKQKKGDVKERYEIYSCKPVTDTVRKVYIQ